MKLELKGRIDSNNAVQVEKEMRDQLTGQNDVEVVLDATDLEYISSAGLRVILRLKKTYPDLRITNVSSEVYEILDMTGFTEMMTVEKAYRVVSVEGCEVIGEGFNGKVYRIDQDNVVKVYKNANALADILGKESGIRSIAGHRRAKTSPSVPRCRSSGGNMRNPQSGPRSSTFSGLSRGNSGIGRPDTEGCENRQPN